MKCPVGRVQKKGHTTTSFDAAPHRERGGWKLLVDRLDGLHFRILCVDVDNGRVTLLHLNLAARRSLAYVRAVGDLPQDVFDGKCTLIRVEKGGEAVMRVSAHVPVMECDLQVVESNARKCLSAVHTAWSAGL